MNKPITGKEIQEIRENYDSGNYSAHNVAMSNDIGALLDLVDEMHALLCEMTLGGPCKRDRGYCVSHGVTTKNCEMEEAQSLLKRLEEQG